MRRVRVRGITQTTELLVLLGIVVAGILGVGYYLINSTKSMTTKGAVIKVLSADARLVSDGVITVTAWVQDMGPEDVKITSIQVLDELGNALSCKWNQSLPVTIISGSRTSFTGTCTGSFDRGETIVVRVSGVSLLSNGIASDQFKTNIQ